jgi:hypothetical protein
MFFVLFFFFVKQDRIEFLELFFDNVMHHTAS